MSETHGAGKARCDRCGTSFEIEADYKMIDFLEKSSAPKLGLDNAMDEHFVICRDCGAEFLFWMRPDIDTREDFLKELRREEFGEATAAD